MCGRGERNKFNLFAMIILYKFALLTIDAEVENILQKFHFVNLHFF